MSKRVSIRDVAAKAGVSISTVSMALKNNPHISQQTRKRIQAIAHKLHYTPNPILGLLSTYRRNQKQGQFVATLGWIDCWDSPNEMFAANNAFRLYFEGAQKRAEESGYHLEIFRLREKGMSEEKLSRVLWSRGVSGLIVGPQKSLGSTLNLDWQLFSAITFGHTLAYPDLHRMCFAHMGASLLAVFKLWKRGYRRIAFLSHPTGQPRLGIVDLGYLGGYLSGCHAIPNLTEIPVFESNILDKGSGRKNFEKWIRKWKPDAVLTHSYPPVYSWLKEMGFSIPQDMGYADTDISAFDEPISGIDLRAREIGAAGVDFLIGMLRKHETDVPAIPTRVAIDGVWKDGCSTRFFPGNHDDESHESLERELSRIQ